MEWFNLAAIHGPSKFYLHDDFYYESGRADQPDEVVEDPDKFPFPALDDVRSDTEALLDYVMTVYLLEAPVTEALANHDNRAILESLRLRVAAWPNYGIESRAYGICAAVIGPVASDWIRDRWTTWNPETFSSLVEATAACLPFDEGFGRVVEVIDGANTLARPQAVYRGTSDYCHVFGHFHSRKILDWMESHPPHEAHEQWGRMSALSHFSWSRADDWLRRGRPFSHVALFAMRSCFNHDTIPLKRFRPTLEEPALVDEMVQRLNECQEADPAPRVRNLAQAIQKHMLAAIA